MKVKILFLSILWFVCFSPAGAILAEDAAPPDPNAPSPSQESPAEPAETEDPNDPPVPAPPEEEYDPFIGPQTDPSITESVIPDFFRSSEILFLTYVSDQNLVRYGDLRRHRSKLYNVYRYLDEIHPAHLLAMNRREKIAFWINVYNVCVLKLIVDNYPIEPKFYMIFYPDNSIMQISNAWTKQYFDIMGLEYTLNEIKDELLLERYKDPRICFAISYASLGGGRLREHAYYPDSLDEQLDEQVQRYLDSHFGYRLDQSQKIIHLSNLFSVHREVFLESDYASIKRFRSYPDHERAWLNFLVNYLPPKDVEFIENNPCTFRMMRFDWTLDEAR